MYDVHRKSVIFHYSFQIVSDEKAHGVQPFLNCSPPVFALLVLKNILELNSQSDQANYTSRYFCRNFAPPNPANKRKFRQNSKPRNASENSSPCHGVWTTWRTGTEHHYNWDTWQQWSQHCWGANARLSVHALNPRNASAFGCVMKSQNRCSHDLWRRPTGSNASPRQQLNPSSRQLVAQTAKNNLLVEDLLRSVVIPGLDNLYTGHYIP